jgi:hypothetical protein
MRQHAAEKTIDAEHDEIQPSPAVYLSPDCSHQFSRAVKWAAQTTERWCDSRHSLKGHSGSLRSPSRPLKLRLAILCLRYKTKDIGTLLTSSNDTLMFPLTSSRSSEGLQNITLLTLLNALSSSPHNERTCEVETKCRTGMEPAEWRLRAGLPCEDVAEERGKLKLHLV